jgi:DNA-binding transcriptional LysR family regulator
MEIRQLEYFLQAYQDRSFGRAAEHLFISQQGLSKTIRRLENELRVELFTRSRTGIEPTEAGVALYDKALELMASLASIKSYVHQAAGAARETLHVGVASGIIGENDARMSYSSFERFVARNPAINLVYEEHSDDSCFDLLTTGLIDVACIAARPFDRGFVTLENNCSGSILIIANDNPLSKAPRLSVSDIAAQTILVPTDVRSVVDQIRAWFHAHGHEPNLRVISNSITTMLRAVYQNQGIIVAIADHPPLVDIARATLVPLSPTSEYYWRSLWVYRTDNPLQALIDVFLTFMLAIPL